MQSIEIQSQRGSIQGRFYPAPGLAARSSGENAIHSPDSPSSQPADSAALLVGGVGGGFDSPAGDAYSKLSDVLPESGISVLRIRYRFPTQLDAAVHDVLAGIRFLQSQGITRVALVGHSFGGAVVIQAAILAPEAVATVITISTQTYGAEGIQHLAPRPILLIHGSDDEVLPESCSIQLFYSAHEPKELFLVPHGSHVLNESADVVFEKLLLWLKSLSHQAARQASPSASAAES